jgi:hypothetical protein
MPFRKNNKFGFTSENPLGKSPVCLKVRVGVREKLLAIPDWQIEIRKAIDDLIERENQKPS